MSDEIFLSYKEQKKSASTPKNYSELKKNFFSLFNIDEKEIDSISFKYTNSDGDEILIDEDSEKSFEKIIEEIKTIDKTIIVEIMEDLDVEDNNNTNTNNNDALRSGMIFKTNNQKENEEFAKKIKELENKNKELIEKNNNLTKEKEKLSKDKKEIIEKNKKLVYQKQELQNEN